MYVIFPADEVVYLSYGRLIYVPYAPTPDNRLNTPIRTLDEEDVDNIPVTPPPGCNPSSSRKASSESANNRASDRPGPSGQNSLERSKRSTRGKVQTPSTSNQNSDFCYQESLERPRQFRVRTPERAFTSNSNKSSKSSKQSSSSSKSRSQPGTTKEKVAQVTVDSPVRHRTSSESATTQKALSSKLSSNSFREFWKPSKNKDKTPDIPPLRPERKKEKKQPPTKLPERKLSYSDYLTVNRERTEIPRSDIINTRSDQCENVPSAKHTVKREKSPVIRFFRAQSSSPRNIPRDKPAFNFDVFFERDSSPGKLSVSSAPRLRPGVSSDSNLVAGKNAAISEKPPTKKRGFFSSLRLKKASESAGTMAANESPLRDLIHPAYNEHLKSHNAVSFKLVRTAIMAKKENRGTYEF